MHAQPFRLAGSYREEVLLADLRERKILFWLEIYDRLRQATAKRTGYVAMGVDARIVG